MSPAICYRTSASNFLNFQVPFQPHYSPFLSYKFVWLIGMLLVKMISNWTKERKRGKQETLSPCNYERGENEWQMWLLIGWKTSFSGDTFNATYMITYTCVYMSKTYLLERPISCLSGAYKNYWFVRALLMVCPSLWQTLCPSDRMLLNNLMHLTFL